MRKLVRGVSYVLLMNGDSSLISDVQRDLKPGQPLKPIARKCFGMDRSHLLLDGTNVPEHLKYRSLGFKDELADPTLVFICED